ncbi:KilA-N domain-containing protein [Paraphaeosphaeria minitans]|uniref:KilA-N domain-containing protein n=1 Tax=Paraphaeosphaeria minitans TaxID=565426 RepID=A0A9P6GP62_9PLEO|nr:KilA-N domain-containing protein [Paraphaeosphaeria minitans]
MLSAQNHSSRFKLTRRAFDHTGQLCPAGRSASVTATFWEGEGTLVFHVQWEGVAMSRREDNHMILGTRLLNVAGRSRGTRDAILAVEKTKQIVETGPTLYLGVWYVPTIMSFSIFLIDTYRIPYERALELANQHRITEYLYPLFVHNIHAMLSHPVSRTTHRSVGYLGITPSPPLIKPTRHGEDLARLKQDESERPLAARRVQEERHEAAETEPFLRAFRSEEPHVMNPGREELKRQKQPPLLEQQNKKQAQGEKGEAARLEVDLDALHLEERQVINTAGEEQKEQARLPLANPLHHAYALQAYQDDLLAREQQNNMHILAARNEQGHLEQDLGSVGPTEQKGPAPVQTTSRLQRFEMRVRRARQEQIEEKRSSESKRPTDLKFGQMEWEEISIGDVESPENTPRMTPAESPVSDFLQADISISGYTRRVKFLSCQCVQ